MYENSLMDLNGKSILVTGGTGSFGKSFLRYVIRNFQPKRLIVYSRDELKQFDMQIHPDFKDHPALRFFLGDVRDLPRLEMAMRGVDYVVHAAALKQIPAAEYNPMETVKTNIHGAENVVQACLRTGVRRVIALSTDKAANPINLYGATKLASDKIFAAANNLSGTDGTRFSIVRYGNVVGSRGSVIPFFQNLIESGAKSLPITDDKMTRFWITVEQGVQFVLSSMHGMLGGEIFVPKLPSMKVIDIARAMAPKLDTHIVGIRPGEKLHEAMITEDDARYTFEMPDRYVIVPVTDDTLREHYARTAKSVPAGFNYVSNVNDHWLDGEGLHRMLGNTEVLQ